MRVRVDGSRWIKLLSIFNSQYKVLLNDVMYFFSIHKKALKDNFLSDWYMKTIDAP